MVLGLKFRFYAWGGWEPWVDMQIILNWGGGAQLPRPPTPCSCLVQTLTVLSTLHADYSSGSTSTMHLSKSWYIVFSCVALATDCGFILVVSAHG